MQSALHRPRANLEGFGDPIYRPIPEEAENDHGPVMIRKQPDPTSQGRVERIGVPDRWFTCRLRQLPAPFPQLRSCPVQADPVGPPDRVVIGADRPPALVGTGHRLVGGFGSQVWITKGEGEGGAPVGHG